MKWFAILVALCCVLPVAAQEPPLVVSVSVTTAEYETGDLVYLTTVIYGTSATPSRLAVQFDAAPGLVLVKMSDNGSGSVWRDHPDTLRMVYRVAEDAPSDGALLRLVVTAQADGAWAQDSVTIRNGTYPWPDAKRGAVVWLPLVRR